MTVRNVSEDTLQALHIKTLKDLFLHINIKRLVKGRIDSIANILFEHLGLTPSFAYEHMPMIPFTNR